MEKIITSQDLLKELETLESNKEIVDAEYTTLKGEQHAEIKVIEDKYETAMSEFNTKVSDYNEKIQAKRVEMIQLEKHEEWMEAINRGEINEFYLNAMLRKCNVDSSDIDIKHKKTLDSGIEVWMINDEGYRPYKLYLAFYNDALVGTSYRETSKHAGDPTTPFSFIGQFEEPLQMEKKIHTGFNTGKIYHENATFTAWIKELKSKNLDDLKYFPMNKDTLGEISNGMTKWWAEWSWEDKAKENK